ncbi:MAG: hypothetical protein IKQ11_06210 [Paludibacteraceae bacterium]|nr:hypothetical protein [Paludibacteraceae bacterium]
MKKSFLLMLSLVCCVSIHAIKIDKDVVTSDGMRRVSASAFNIYTEFSTAAAANVFAMEVNLDGEDHRDYFLTLFLNEGIFEIEKGSKLLLKLENDEVIELEAFEDVLKDAFMIRSGSVQPQYLIPMESLSKLTTGNVVKIRIETSNGIIDRKIKGNKFSKGVLESVTLINKAFQKKKDVYSDF